MAKTRKLKEDNEEKTVKENVQKRFKSMFSEANQPLSNMSIQEVEALKARVAELEAKLEQQPGAVEHTASNSKPLITRQDTGRQSLSMNKQKRDSFPWNLLRAPTFESPALDRVAKLQHRILMGLFATGLLSIIALLWSWSETTPASLAIASFGIALFGLAAFWQRKGHIELASWVLVGTFYSILLYSIVPSGLSTSTVIQAALVISLAGLLLRPFKVVLVTLVSLFTLFALQYLFPSSQIDPNQLMFTIILLGLEGLLLIVASSTLEQSFSEADRSRQDILHANQTLQDLTTNLEQRVLDRTHDLELASEVGRIVSEKVENLPELLTEAVEMIRARFNLYYTQIYLMDPSARNIILRAGTGEVGKQLLQRGHHLPIASGSLNGRAARDKRTIIVEDTKNSPNFLPNLLLPKTHSEMSIPLLASGKVVGVLDVQSEQAGALNETNLPAFEALAGQLAIAIENAALFTQAEQARSAVEVQMQHLTEKGWQDFLNAIDREQQIGYVFDQSKVIRLQAGALATQSEAHDLSIPISVAGSKIGEIQLPVEKDHSWTNNELELTKATSAQLAQHIENLRLLAQAEKYRAEAEQATRRLTREGWDTHLQASSELAAGYMYNLNEVQALSRNKNDKSNTLRQSLVVHSESIGELTVDTPDRSDETAEIITAIAGQLSSHIENLRLSELNEKHAQREQMLRQITSALRSSTNPATIMQTAVRELGSVLGRRTAVQLAAHEPANQAESAVRNENESNSSANQS